MNITPDDPRLTAFALSELDPEETRELSAVLRDEPDLQCDLDAIDATMARLRSALAIEPVTHLFPHQHDLIERAAQTARPPSSAQRRWHWQLWVPAMTGALIVIGALILGPVMPTEQVSTFASAGTAMGEVSRSHHPEERQRAIATLPMNSPAVAEPTSSSRELKAKLGGKAPSFPNEELFAATRGQSSHSPKPFDDVRTPAPMAPPALPGRGSPTDAAFTTERYPHHPDADFRAVADHPLSTFSIDVDTASYSNVRRFLTGGQWPPPDAVRIEEFINSFRYSYEPPRDDRPFGVAVEVAPAPWRPTHQLARIALKARELDPETRPPCNLVFLIDVSGSMQDSAKLPLVKSALRALVETLRPEDRVALVVYAGSSGLALPSTPASDKETILQAIDQLEAGGSTNGAQGIELAYATAQRHASRGTVSRVILATDGDFNVGLSTPGDLVRLIEQKAKTGVFLSVLGFGMGNYKDDTLEALAGKGNGNYAYIDTLAEARKALVEQAAGTLFTVAKDVKIQVEFNPAHVRAYRLIGYDNRILAKEDFNNDAKDAGDIGAGHTVTALYEIVPVSAPLDLPKVDPLRYQTGRQIDEPEPVRSDDATALASEWFTVKLRYKQPDHDESQKIEVPVSEIGDSWARASADFKFAAAVSAFGMILRGSSHAGNATLDSVAELAREGLDSPHAEERRAFLDLLDLARTLEPSR